MNIRENLENLEKEYLSPYAAHSIDSKGREREEEQCCRGGLPATDAPVPSEPDSTRT